MFFFSNSVACSKVELAKTFIIWTTMVLLLCCKRWQACSGHPIGPSEPLTCPLQVAAEPTVGRSVQLRECCSVLLHCTIKCIGEINTATQARLMTPM